MNLNNIIILQNSIINPLFLIKKKILDKKKFESNI